MNIDSLRAAFPERNILYFDSLDSTMRAAAENGPGAVVIANRQLADNTIIVFRANDLQGRTVLLVLSGVAAAARTEEKKQPQAPPLTLKLSYIVDPAHPDIFRIGKGQF